MKTITRKNLLYKTSVEYGDYTINHVVGCSHGCLYPCYAMLMAKRFGTISCYQEWLQPKLVGNALDILEREVPKLKHKIKFVQLCFTTDPFMYGYPEISEMSYKIIQLLNRYDVKCTALTKGLLPIKLSNLSSKNEFGITLITINDKFRQQLEPGAAPMKKRIAHLKALHDKGLKTWVSIEPYPTPNIINQNLNEILNTLGFVDKIIFGRLNYNSQVSAYPGYKEFFNQMALQVISFAKKHKKEYHIKKGTISENLSNNLTKTAANTNILVH